VAQAGALIAALCGLAAPRQITGPASRILTEVLPLTGSDVERLAAGRTVAHSLDTEDGREVATMGAVTMNVTPAQYAAALRDIAGFKRTDAVLQIGAFSDPPALRDVERLTLDSSDLDRLRDCQIRDCGVQLPAAAIVRFRQMDWSAPGAGARANETFRALLVEYARNYRARGNAALMQYVDDSVVVDVAAEFRHLVDSDPRILRRFPPLYRHMLTYPATRRPDIDDVLYWSKQKIGPRQVVTITHLAVWRSHNPGMPAYVAASKQIYGSVYFDASLGLTVLVSTADGKTIVAYVNRSRVDAFGGLLGPFKRGLVRMRARAVMAKLLKHTKQRLESEAPTSAIGRALRSLATTAPPPVGRGSS
jgi:hypothetical protein